MVSFLPWSRSAVPANDADFEIISIPDDSSTFGVESLPDSDINISSLDRYAQIPSRDYAPDLTSVSSWFQHYSISADDYDRTCEPLDNFDEHSTFPQGNDNAYAEAGRGDGNHRFLDIRSPSKAVHRRRTRNAKYREYKAVNPGQLGAEHYAETDAKTFYVSHIPADLPVKIMSKRELFDQAQSWPVPPTYHRGRKHRSWQEWTAKATKRRIAAKHALDMISEQEIELLEMTRLLCYCSECFDIDQGQEDGELGVPSLPYLSLEQLASHQRVNITS